MNWFKKKQSDLPRRRLVERENTAARATSADIFRRNRTLTGTTSNYFNSIASIKSDLESPRAHVHHLSIRRRKILNILLIVVAISICLWALVCNFTATINIKTSDTELSKPIDVSRYEKVIQDYLSINPMSRLHFLLDNTALTAYVSSRLPEVASVKQRGIAGLDGTSFVITMRTPVAGWVIENKQYYVDSKGVSFEHNYFSEPVVQIVDDSGITSQTGTTVASKRFLRFVGRVVSLSKTSGYTVTQAVLPANTTRQLAIRVKECNFLIKLSIDRPVGEQVEDMSRAVKHLIGQGRTPSYVDVRVSGKTFYK
jgi:hypothetical protein